MQSQGKSTTIALALLLVFFAATPAFAQTDIGASLYGAFSRAASGNGVQESPSDAAGVSLELRHIRSRWVGYEVTYSFNRANQTYRPTDGLACPPSGPCTAAVSANAHVITGDWVFSVPISYKLQAFYSFGGGIVLNEPVSGQANTTSSDSGVFEMHIGFDWRLLPHTGLRAQLVLPTYKAPDVTTVFHSTGEAGGLIEPMLGFYYQF